MLRKFFIRDDSELIGHYFYKSLPWGDNWYYDKFGRYPGIGDVIVYPEYNEDTELYKMCFGLIMYKTPHILSYGRGIDVFYFAPLRNPGAKKDDERFIRYFGKTGLAAFSPLYDLSYVRAKDGIVLLDPYIFTLSSPHML